MYYLNLLSSCHQADFREKQFWKTSALPFCKNKNLNYYIAQPLNMIIRLQKQERQKCSILNKSTITNKWRRDSDKGHTKHGWDKIKYSVFFSSTLHQGHFSWELYIVKRVWGTCHWRNTDTCITSIFTWQNILLSVLHTSSRT